MRPPSRRKASFQQLPEIRLGASQRLVRPARGGEFFQFPKAQFSLVVSGQIKLRRIDGWRKIATVLSQPTQVAA